MAGEIAVGDAFVVAVEDDGSYVAVLDESVDLPVGLGKTVVSN